MSAAPRPFSGGAWLDPPPALDWSKVKVTAEGDSLTNPTEEDGIATPWPTLLGTMRLGLTVSNVATSGDNSNAISAAQVNAQWDATKDHNICVLWNGAVDASDVDPSASECGDNIAAFISALRASHPTWVIIVIKIIPRVGFITEPNRAAYNAEIESSATGADLVIDISSALGEAGNSTSYYADGHLKTAGMQIVAEQVEAAILSLTGEQVS